jgi:hypothetical protein
MHAHQSLVDTDPDSTHSQLAANSSASWLLHTVLLACDCATSLQHAYRAHAVNYLVKVAFRKIACARTRASAEAILRKHR